MTEPADYVDSHYRRSLSDQWRWRPLGRDLKAEVCVVGGGLAGLNTALGLAERDRQVVLLEGKRAGWGASGRNGGFVMAGFALPAQRLAARIGLSRARSLHAMTVEALSLIRTRIDDFDIDCGPVQDGIVVAGWHGSGQAIKRHASFLRKEMGTPVEYWPGEKLRQMYRTDRYVDAVFDPTAFHLHPLNFTRGIARAADRAGVVLHEDSPVLAIEPAPGGHLVRTETGSVRAEQVVVCCSGYIGRTQKRLAAATLPVATYMLLTEPLGERLAEAIRAPHAIADNRMAGDYYRALPDGRILWGGRVSAFKTPPRRLAEVMLGDLRKVYPQLAGARAEVAWEGLMGYARHRMPQIGQLTPGLWYCMGFGGKGMGTTTLGGELIARAIAEDDESWRAFEAFGLGHAGGPLRPAIAQAAYWWYQMRDAARL
ncbi:MAG: FAD-binding oxidoreductase [Alphaproteobacteria bacterium]|jgi:gamma-glutamylputrescine oxidase|nr:FAD-binding oxidoreductase [Alphaproteobacteria bacterium]MDP6816184.1 FAD-binding oxidoreductase [Alphaproteobacteria bacterium]